MSIGSPPRRTQAEPPARRVAAWVKWWAALMSLWLLLVASISVPELLAGAAAAAIAATLVELAEYQAGVRLTVRAEWLAGTLRLPVDIARDTALVLRTAVLALAGRRPRSSFHVVPVDAGGDDPADASRRALVTVATSLPPNAIALGIDAEQGVMLVHRLVRPARPMPGERRVSATR